MGSRVDVLTGARTQLLTGVSLLWLATGSLGAQRCPHGVVVDATGAAVPNARVTWTLAGQQRGTTTAADGAFRFACSANEVGGSIRATGAGLQSDAIPSTSAADLRLVARPTALREQVSVTATRSGVEVGPQAQTITALSREQLTQYPALTLDERLRQKAGFELFRRSSSWVANPTSQGISLRGLGSTAASRTLVLADGVPLNDAFGGWVHWNEIPPDAIDGVTLATGGGSDLYGSSALGGVIDLLPSHPVSTQFTAGLTEASEGTAEQHGRAHLVSGSWSALVAGEGFRTAGYVPTAPSFAGRIDRPANVHYQTGRGQLTHSFGGDNRAFLTGNLLNEARDNGTELQTNGTRLWRWIAGDDWAAGAHSSGRLRVFGSDEHYRQTFSAVNAPRSAEFLTRRQRVGDQEFGATADGGVHWSHAAAIFGADLRDIRATDTETPISAGRITGIQQTSARQRFVGGFAELLATAGGWSGSASLRVDNAADLDTLQFATAPSGNTARTAIADRSERVLSPRLGLVRALPGGWQLQATAFRAFRAPTPNELYRTGQVGQETTLANPQLRNERATGAEGGATWSSARLAANAGYFWAEINRPVSAVLVSSTPTAITNRRENLGQIVSQGLEAGARINEGHTVSGTVSFQYAHAVVTRFSAQPALVGRWIPNVPRSSITAQLRADRPRWGSAILAMRAGGHQYDDSSNLYPLSAFFLLDVYAEHSLPHGWTAFAAVQNLLNQRPEVARTPVLTLGSPVLAQGGVRYTWRRREP